MNSGNPVLSGNVFSRARAEAQHGALMTIDGTVTKSLILFLLLLLTATFTWSITLNTGNPASATPWMFLGMIVGLVTAITTVFKVSWSPITAPIYALSQGLFLGGISALMEAEFPGIVVQAVGATFATLAVMLFAFETGFIRATERFKLGVVSATGGIALFYLVAIVLSFFGINIGILTSGGLFGVLFSLFVCAVAALNLILDFDLIQQGAARGAPKFMEWYGAFALMVTLVWLYLEILRLLAKTRSNR